MCLYLSLAAPAASLDGPQRLISTELADVRAQAAAKLPHVRPTK